MPTHGSCDFFGPGLGCLVLVPQDSLRRQGKCSPSLESFSHNCGGGGSSGGAKKPKEMSVLVLGFSCLYILVFNN